MFWMNPGATGDYVFHIAVSRKGRSVGWRDGLLTIANRPASVLQWEGRRLRVELSIGNKLIRVPASAEVQDGGVRVEVFLDGRMIN